MFTDFVCGLDWNGVPDAARSVMRRSLLDTLGVAAIGTTTANAAIARQIAEALFGASSAIGGSRMLFHGSRVSPAGAALAGAAAVDSIDAHDGNSSCKGHAGSAIVPSLLAIADAQAEIGRPMDGRRFATLMALGYEVAYRTGLSQHASSAEYHTSGAWTAVGIAAMVARALGADAMAVRHAVGIAEYHGPRCPMMRCIDHPTMVRDGVAWGAPSGIGAGYMAILGFTGAPAATVEAEVVQPFWSDLGSAWRIVDQTHYKRYPVCRWAHPAMDAVGELMEQNGLQSAQLARIKINTFHNATRLATRHPQTLDEATYSIIFAVGAMAARGGIGLAELRPEALADSEINRLADVTELVDDDHYTRISTGKRWADVELTTTDGRVLRSGPKSPKGDPDDPLSDEEIDAKFHVFADPIVGHQAAQEIKDASASIDLLSAGDLARLLSLVLEAPAREANAA